MHVSGMGSVRRRLGSARGCSVGHCTASARDLPCAWLRSARRRLLLQVLRHADEAHEMGAVMPPIYPPPQGEDR